MTIRENILAKLQRSIFLITFESYTNEAIYHIYILARDSKEALDLAYDKLGERAIGYISIKVEAILGEWLE